VVPLALGASQGGYLLGTIVVSMLIGTAYSAPPVRLKRSPLYAAACIVVVRAFVINLGLFLHFDHVVGGPGTVPAAVWALVTLTVLFSLVIAVSKDIPDTEGDRRHGIMTLPRRLGARRVFQLGRATLTGAYLLPIAAAAVGWIAGVDAWVLVGGHGLLLAALWLRSRSVVPEDQRSITPYYLFLWRLFQLEYVLFPATALLP
jgi:homogentisate phytyltransferase/homogentisate geranylgeranyltransferase